MGSSNSLMLLCIHSNHFVPVIGQDTCFIRHVFVNFKESGLFKKKKTKAKNVQQHVVYDFLLLFFGNDSVAEVRRGLFDR